MSSDQNHKVYLSCLFWDRGDQILPQSYCIIIMDSSGKHTSGIPVKKPPGAPFLEDPVSPVQFHPSPAILSEFRGPWNFMCCLSLGTAGTRAWRRRAGRPGQGGRGSRHDFTFDMAVFVGDFQVKHRWIILISSISMRSLILLKEVGWR